MQSIGVSSSDILPDGSFSASSERSGHGASKGRLNGAGAWEPKNNNDPIDYLQIDLQYEFVICAVATQGSAKADEWTTEYKLQLSFNDIDWIIYEENAADKVGFTRYGRKVLLKAVLRHIFLLVWQWETLWPKG